MAVALYLAFSVAGGVTLAELQVHLHRRPVPATPPNLQDVEIHTADGLTLRGWFGRPEHGNGRAVILLHGITDNRAAMVGYGQFFMDHGYSVLLPDARAHGSSDGVIASYGLKEAGDVHLWTDWLFARESPACLYGLGESLGAGILLQSLAVEKRFCAVIAESPFADARSAIFDRVAYFVKMPVWMSRTVFRLPIEICWIYAQWRYGLRFDSVSPRRAVAQSRTPVLLISDTDDVNLRPHNSREILAARPALSQLWEVPGAGHTGARKAAPAEFDRRVLDYFGSSPAAPAAGGAIVPM